MKDLPPVERRADSSLYRMDARQRREAVRLIKGLCSYHDGGNCLYLDRGEEVTCPQSISYSVCCKFFRHVLLKHEEGKGLETKIFQRNALRRCERCGRAFSSSSNRAKYCADCKAEVQRRQKAEHARRRRAESRKVGLKRLEISSLFSPKTGKAI